MIPLHSRLDILVMAEHIGRIVSVFQPYQPLEGRRIPGVLEPLRFLVLLPDVLK